jgi:predicted RNA-binding Zn-ribbon protein involved in translation (DUF1610 family)
MGAKLVLLNDDGEKLINIFIHGFGGLNKEEYHKHTARVNELELPGRTYFLYWPSGSWLIPKPVVTTLKVGGKIVKNIKVTPAQFLANIVVDIVLNTLVFVVKYKYYEKKAEKLGSNLLRHISKIPNANKYPINLIGFSLGARVIHWALWDNEWNRYRLNDIFLLGGATDSLSGDWSECAEKISGKIYNVYSKNDMVLTIIKPDWEYCIGISPIPERHPRIKNIKCDLGHKFVYDYITNLKWLFDTKIQPNRKISKNYSNYMPLKCPWKECEHEFLGTPYTPVECPECGVVFTYNHADEEFKFSDEYPEPISIECPCCEIGLFPVQESAEWECPYCGTWTKCERKGNKIEFFGV